MEDISALLSLEVKKEIADRYFRFRKIIEEDAHSYKQRIITLSLDLDNSIGSDLVCIYALLQDTELIHIFFDITGLSEGFFFECDLHTSPELRKKVINSRRIHGLTRKSCFLNLFFDTYKDLFDHITDYRSAMSQLRDDHEAICEQIKIFYRKNDISSILQFLKGLDNSREGDFNSAGGEVAGMDNFYNLDEKLRLYPPDPVENLLPNIPAIPSPKKVRTQLKKLILSAWSKQPGLNLRRM